MSTAGGEVRAAFRAMLSAERAGYKLAVALVRSSHGKFCILNATRNMDTVYSSMLWKQHWCSPYLSTPEIGDAPKLASRPSWARAVCGTSGLTRRTALRSIGEADMANAHPPETYWQGHELCFTTQ